MADEREKMTRAVELVARAFDPGAWLDGDGYAKGGEAQARRKRARETVRSVLEEGVSMGAIAILPIEETSNGGDNAA